MTDLEKMSRQMDSVVERIAETYAGDTELALRFLTISAFVGHITIKAEKQHGKSKRRVAQKTVAAAFNRAIKAFVEDSEKAQQSIVARIVEDINNVDS